MGTNGGDNIFVLYKIGNDSDNDDPHFNAFSMPRGPNAPTLLTVKQYSAALHGLNHMGPEGYHWRVCIEDKPFPGDTSSEKTFSWWDVQDENAKLPVKRASQYELAKFFAPSKPSDSTVGTDAAKAAKGALKSFGKVMTSAVTGHSDGGDHGPPVNVIAFRLLDLVKMHDDFDSKNKSRGGRMPAQQSAPSQRAPRPAATAAQHHRPQMNSTPARPAAQPRTAAAPPAHQQQRRPAAPAARPAAPRPPPQQQEASLMDFGPAPRSAPARHFHHSTSSPGIFSHVKDETRAEKLKREYAEKNQTSNRIWDEVDERWVEVDANAAAVKQGTTSAPPGAIHEVPQKKEVGISLDPSNAVGKSANVQAAVHARVNEMRMSQQKALDEVRAREEKKKSDEAEEDIVRKRLEPRIKAWSEEHGKKKQLRALLASLHTILWPGADWKPIGIGDILDDGKVKRAFHKASRVVHPDKTHHLDVEQRFLAKRIFDALSQAKNQFDEGK